MQSDTKGLSGPFEALVTPETRLQLIFNDYLGLSSYCGKHPNMGKHCKIIVNP